MLLLLLDVVEVVLAALLVLLVVVAKELLELVDELLKEVEELVNMLDLSEELLLATLVETKGLTVDETEVVIVELVVGEELDLTK